MPWGEDSQQRLGWVFDYPVRAILAGARRKYAYHVERARAYADEHAKLSAVIQQVSVSLQEEEPAEMTQFYAGSNAATRAQSELDQIQRKLEHHRAQARDYLRYVVALAHQDPEQFQPCTVDDIAYFGLEDETAAEPGVAE